MDRNILMPVCLVFIILLTAHAALAQSAAQKAVKESSPGEKAAEKSEPEKALHAGPVDEFDRGVPRSSVKGYFKAARDGDFEQAAQYLDMRNLPRWMKKYDGAQLARQFKVVLDRVLWIELELISDDPKGITEDGLPSYRDSLGRIKTPVTTVDIWMQRVPRKDGVLIWMFSNRTVAQIPHLYKHFGYTPYEEQLSRWFPDVTVFGWQSWQWAFFLAAIAIAYLIALVPTWIVGFLLRRRQTEMSLRLARFFTGPVRVVLWFLVLLIAVRIIRPSATIRSIIEGGTILIFAFTWATLRMIDLGIDWWAERLQKSGEEGAAVLLQPVKNVAKIVITLLAVVLWLDNIGFNVGTLLAGLGVGGIAIALAAQDTLKNFIASIMILLDKPYRIGQRIVVKGHDGVVEAIGLRSTRIRLLTGHQTTIPNDEMVKIDIENIGRRPHIRRLTNITIRHDTPLGKVEKAVRIIENILENHEGMDPKFPPRVYFNEFNHDSLNILVLYWYHPPNYWDFLALNQRVNTQIMREFEMEGIKFALPTTKTYLTQDDGQPLHLGIAKDSHLTGDSALA